VAGSASVAGSAGVAGVASPSRGGAAEPPWEAEPIDLLAVTDARAAVRRALPYVATAFAGFLLLAGVLRWATRGRRR
jgi:hypothetical protein